MPAALAYTWTQTDSTLQVCVQLRGAERRRPEIQTTSVHLQLNSPPHLLVLDLYSSIVVEDSSVRLDSDGVTFNLRKEEERQWPDLLSSAPRSELQARRSAALEERTAACRAAEAAREAKLQESVRAAADAHAQQIARQARATADLKSQQEAAESAALAAWAEQNNAGHRSDSDSEADTPPSDAAADIAYFGRGWQGSKAATSATPAPAANVASAPPAHHHQSNGAVATSLRSHNSRVEPALADDTKLPPAALHTVQVTFTPVLAANPSQPARQPLFDQHDAKAGKPSLDRSRVPGEAHPGMLAAKGDSMAGQGNLQGAVNAYTAALALDASHLSSLVGRASCRLLMKDWRGCLDDCHNARVKLQAESVKSVPLDAHIKEVTESRLEAISASALAGLQRRGSAQDTADNGQPDRAETSQDGLSSSKEDADKLLRNKDAVGALAAYDLLIAEAAPQDSSLHALYANRAVALLALQRWEEACSSCDSALHHLLDVNAGHGQEAKLADVQQALQACLKQPKNLSASAAAGCNSVSPCSIDKGVGTLMTAAMYNSAGRLMARRGTAALHLNRREQCLMDYQLAQQLLAAAGNTAASEAISSDMRQLMAEV